MRKFVSGCAVGGGANRITNLLAQSRSLQQGEIGGRSFRYGERKGLDRFVDEAFVAANVTKVLRDGRAPRSLA